MLPSVGGRRTVLIFLLVEAKSRGGQTGYFVIAVLNILIILTRNSGASFKSL